jgi:hypothetical protein
MTDPGPLDIDTTYLRLRGDGSVEPLPAGVKAYGLDTDARRATRELEARPEEELRSLHLKIEPAGIARVGAVDEHAQG